MKDNPKARLLLRWAHSWHGEGQAIERALLVVACGTTGVVISLALGTNPYLLGSVSTVIGFLAVIQRR